MENLPLEELELRMKAIFEAAVDGIFTIDRRGIIESVNIAGCQLFGFSAAELLGKNISMLADSPHREAHDTYINNYLETGHKKIIGIGREVKGRKKDGSLFPFWLSVSEFRMGDRIIFTGFIHDITALKAAETEVRQLNSQLEIKISDRTEELADAVNRLLSSNKKLEREVAERETAEKLLQEKQEKLLHALARERELGELKSRFVSLASHEFRTPLSTILSSAALVRRYADMGNDEKRSFHLEKIKSAVIHLTGILDDFLSLTKLEEGRVENKPEHFDFREFCLEVTEEMQGLTKTGQMILCNGDTVPLPVFLDKRILKNILYNLISNAIKYSEADVVCQSQLENDGQFLKIAIRDFGIGIPESEQKHLFERFFRAKNATNIQGSGLGLNIVRRYLDLLDGEISFESREADGTTFFVKIPLPNSLSESEFTEFSNVLNAPNFQNSKIL